MARTPDNSNALELVPLGRNSAGQGLLLATMALLALGVVMVNSAMARPVGRAVEWYSRTDFRHTMFALMAVGVILFAWRFDYHRLGGKRLPWLALGALGAALVTCGLIFVPGLGVKEGEYYRWLKIIKVGSFELTMQPSELVKFTLPIMLAAWLGRLGVNCRSFWKTFLPALAVIGVATAAVIKQDFSTGAIVVVSGMATLLLADVPLLYLLMLVPPAIVGAYKAVFRDEYHMNRIIAWLNPWSDNPAAYQGRESLLAILTGGWTGKGLGHGTVKNGFLPEGGTDFIFSVYCEELGFAGALLLLGLLMLWIWHARKAAVNAPDKFGRLLAGSLGLLLMMQAVIHIAVALMMAPTAGQGLPFMSYGGTSLVMSAGAVALIMSVSARNGPAPNDAPGAPATQQ